MVAMIVLWLMGKVSNIVLRPIICFFRPISNSEKVIGRDGEKTSGSRKIHIDTFTCLALHNGVTEVFGDSGSNMLQRILGKFFFFSRFQGFSKEMQSGRLAIRSQTKLPRSSTPLPHWKRFAFNSNTYLRRMVG